VLSGVAKALLAMDSPTIHQKFVADHAEGWNAYRDRIQSLAWEDIAHRGGVCRQKIERVAEMYSRADKAIFCWAMGVTHHEHGVKNVQMIANLAIMRGMLGRPGTGLLPLRGHSNVQGIGSMGVTPKLKQAVFDKLQSEFQISLPTSEGWDTLTCMHEAHEGSVRFASCLGGNLFGSNPDATFAHQAMSKIDLVMYMNTTLNTGHAWGRGRETIILPVLPRDEELQATTQESMFNYVRMSDGGKPRIPGVRSEVDIIASIAEAVLGSERDGPIQWHALKDHAKLRRMIACIVPGYERLADLDQTRKEFTISGRVFHEPTFSTDTGRAKMHAIDLPPLLGEEPGQLRLMTMRSEGQFNTVVYEEEDIYRGQERRDVILMNAADMQRMGLNVDDRVVVRTAAGRMSDILVREGDLPPGNCAMYYPEANVLIPRNADVQSRTPAFKSVVAEIRAVDDKLSAIHHTNEPKRSGFVAAGSSRNRMNRC
jgi:molybdopterin-dependent oxidoreductase alpha subunit